MWEDLTIALCGVGFVAAVTLLLVELSAILTGAAWRGDRLPRS